MIQPTDPTLHALHSAVSAAKPASDTTTNKGAGWFEDPADIQLSGSVRAASVEYHARAVLSHLCGSSQQDAY